MPLPRWLKLVGVQLLSAGRVEVDVGDDGLGLVDHPIVVYIHVGRVELLDEVRDVVGQSEIVLLVLLGPVLTVTSS